MEPTMHITAFTTARVVLGLLFLFQAYDKIFRITLPEVCKEVFGGTAKKGIPQWFSNFSVYASSFLELVFGGLMVIGLFTDIALLVLSAHLILLTLSFSFLQGVWDMKHVFPRLALVLFLLLSSPEWNAWSLDAILSR